MNCLITGMTPDDQLKVHSQVDDCYNSGIHRINMKDVEAQGKFCRLQFPSHLPNTLLDPNSGTTLRSNTFFSISFCNSCAVKEMAL